MAGWCWIESVLARSDDRRFRWPWYKLLDLGSVRFCDGFLGGMKFRRRWDWVCFVSAVFDAGVRRLPKLDDLAVTYSYMEGRDPFRSYYWIGLMSAVIDAFLLTS